MDLYKDHVSDTSHIYTLVGLFSSEQQKSNIIYWHNFIASTMTTSVRSAAVACNRVKLYYKCTEHGSPHAELVHKGAQLLCPGGVSGHASLHFQAGSQQTQACRLLSVTIYVENLELWSHTQRAGSYWDRAVHTCRPCKRLLWIRPSSLSCLW